MKNRRHPGESRFHKYLALALAATLAKVCCAGELVVGQVTPLTGLEAGQGTAYAEGMAMCFSSLNKAGGVNGHTFSLVSQDDAGRPEDTVKLTEQLIARRRPIVLAGYIGSRNVDELVRSGMLEQHRLALVGYRTSDIRPVTPWVYGVRAALQDEIRKITQHLATIGIKRLGLFYEDGPAARGMLSVAGEAACGAGTEIVVSAAYVPGSAKVAPAVTLFMGARPQAILMVSSGAAAAAFIERYRTGGGSAQLFATSTADVEQLSKRLADEQLQGVAIAQVVPNPYKISSRLGKELKELVNGGSDRQRLIGYAMMEGFIACKVIAEAVRRQGRTPSSESLPAALESMRNVDIGGYVVDFGPGNHTGSKFVELSIVSAAGRIRQ